MNVLKMEQNAFKWRHSHPQLSYNKGARKAVSMGRFASQVSPAHFLCTAHRSARMCVLQARVPCVPLVRCTSGEAVGSCQLKICGPQLEDRQLG